MDARAWDERYAATELVWSAGPNQFVESELKGLRPGRALDLAAGEGRNAIWLAEQGWEVTAADFSLVGVDKGRAALAQRPGGRDLHVEWVHADVVEYDPAPVPFDLVLIAYLMVSVFTYIRMQAIKVLQVSYGGFGPTELRLVMLAANLVAYLIGPKQFAVPVIGLISPFDVVALLLFVGAVISVSFGAITIGRQIALEDQPAAHAQVSAAPGE